MSSALSDGKFPPSPYRCERASSPKNNALLLLLVNQSEAGVCVGKLKWRSSSIMSDVLCKALWIIVYQVVEAPKQQHWAEIWFPHVTAGSSVSG